MSDRLNFEAESFAVQPEFEGEFQEFAAEQSDAEWAGESGRMRRFPSRVGQPASRFSRSAGRFPRQPSRPRTVPPRRPTLRPPRPRPYPWSPRVVVRDLYSIVREPYSVEPAATVISGSEYIRWVQDCLNHILGLRLPLTGVLGLESRSAIRSFQKQQGLAVSGIVGPDTERALLSARARLATGTGPTQPSEPEEFEAFDSEWTDLEWEEESNRNSRDYIMWVQRSLNQLLGLNLAVDGISGTMTKSAVRSFQMRQGLQVDGIVGPQTEAALIKLGASRPPGSSSTVPPSYGGGVPSYGGGYEPGAGVGTGSGGTLDIVTVRGIEVARSISAALNSMLTAAQAAGIVLTGSGYRSPQRQIDLRIQNCGPTHYDIYDKPSNQCSPHTAKPGTSNHEKGLAIDFTLNGGTADRAANLADPRFRWLQANAERFGFSNYPPEPWHWSCDGK